MQIISGYQQRGGRLVYTHGADSKGTGPDKTLEADKPLRLAKVIRNLEYLYLYGASLRNGAVSHPMFVH